MISNTVKIPITQSKIIARISFLKSKFSSVVYIDKGKKQHMNKRKNEQHII